MHPEVQNSMNLLFYDFNAPTQKLEGSAYEDGDLASGPKKVRRPTTSYQIGDRLPTRHKKSRQQRQRLGASRQRKARVNLANMSASPINEKREIENFDGPFHKFAVIEEEEID
jgi:hypothetical protein